MNECARARRRDAVFAVSRGVRAAFARRDAARARDRPLRACRGIRAFARARLARGARKPSFCASVDQSFRGAREISAVRFAAMYRIREISRIQRAIGTIHNNADARSRDRTAARVADGGDRRDAAIVIEIYRSTHAMYEISHVYYTRTCMHTRARPRRRVEAVGRSPRSCRHCYGFSFVADRRRQPSRRARRADAPTTARWTARVVRATTRARSRPARRRRASWTTTRRARATRGETTDGRRRRRRREHRRRGCGATREARTSTRATTRRAR